MKKILSFALVFVILVGILPIANAAGTFDYQTVLGSRAGYEYDKFDKQWSYYRAASKTFSDAYVVLGMKVYGEEGGSNPEYTSLYVKILDTDGNARETITGIDFLIGDDMYSFESMLQDETDSSVVLRNAGQCLIEAINNANIQDITVRINTKRYYYTYDASEFDDFSSTIKEFCRVFVKYNINTYYTDDDFYGMLESVWPLTLNGEVVDAPVSSEA